MKLIIAGLLSSLLFQQSVYSAVVPGNRFIIGQIVMDENAAEWDPYPMVSRDILSFLHQTTSVKSVPEKKLLSLNDSEIFDFPFLMISGSNKFHWSKDQRESIKRYLSGGGFLLVEDRAGERGGSFDYSFRQEIKKVFPEKTLEYLPKDHAIFRSFYLLRSVSGRKLTNSYLERLEIDGRTALVYSENDLLGAWAKDIFGNYMYACSPGGEGQRWESQKLMINLILYCLTGTYKSDSIHIPFIDDKLRR